MYLLDTNTVSALHLGHPKIISALQKIDDELLAITIITKAELLQGRIAYLLKAAPGEDLLKAQTYLEETERRLNEIEIIPFDRDASLHFERLKAIRSLRKSGQADLLIASIALANDAILVTRNLKDFQTINQLQVINWLD